VRAAETHGRRFEIPGALGLRWVRGGIAETESEGNEMSDRMIERLSDEADLCRSDGANDIADLLDEAGEAIKSARAENARMRSELERPMSSEAKVLVHDNARLRAEVQRLEAELSMATVLHARLTHEAIKAQARCIELEAEVQALRGAVPAGWRLVPIEPTEEMLDAADAADREYTRRNFGDVMTVMQGPYDHWCSMVAAAPQPAAQADPFTYVIQHLNSSPYALTKDECITKIKELRALYQAQGETK